MPTRTQCALAWVLFTIALGSSGSRRAEANGRFPSAQYVVVGPGTASQSIVLRATFGLVYSDDGGRTFRFLCEEAFQYFDGEDPSLAISYDSTILVGVSDGLMAMQDRCVARRRMDTRDQRNIDLAMDRTGRTIVVALTSSDPVPVGRIGRSDDGGLTFRTSADGFPGVTMQTVEIASSDLQRLYASGTDTMNNRHFLYRSDDGGITWRTMSAAFAGTDGVFVSGIDPVRPDVLYVRVLLRAGIADAGAADATALLRSDDGGESFREIVRTVGAMNGFAISDDGSHVWIGGPDPRDGLQRSDDGGEFHRVNEQGVDCLRFHGGALYVCGAYARGAMMLGRSTDLGAAITSLVRFSEIRPPPACPSGTIVEDICTSRWPPIRNRLDPASTRDAGPPIGAESAMPPPRSCACSLARTARPRGRNVALGAVVIAVCIVAARRRTARS